MIYVVSGYRRSGTSAMMAALGAGGLSIIANLDLEHYNQGPDGYKPNPKKLYEVGQSAYLSPWILEGLLMEGTAIKVFFDGLPTLPAGDYRVLFMTRDPAEIEESSRIAREAVMQSCGEVSRGGRVPFDVYSPYSQAAIDWVLGICEQRQDVDLSVVDFRELVKTPETVLERLRLPIDLDRAAAEINPDFYRVRRNDNGSQRVVGL